MATRCGSYPFMNIAEDFGLPYHVVLQYAQGVENIMFMDKPAGYWADSAAEEIRTSIHPINQRRFNAVVCKAIAKLQADRYPEQSQRVMTEITS